MAGSRGLIHRPVLDALVDKIEEKMKGVVIGDPLETATNIGPLCTEAQLERIQATLAKATEQGARIRFGGKPLDRPGNYMDPTLVEMHERRD